MAPTEVTPVADEPAAEAQVIEPQSTPFEAPPQVAVEPPPLQDPLHLREYRK